ncbi:MAG: hypothetical protein IPQ05_13420 [Leptospiraceae bacterium]|nr:hypothetical protein [Leptospiraceae bacterium]
MYDPIRMPPKLIKAHQELDKAVDAAYRSKPFESEAKRMEFLFELYEKYTADLFTKKKEKKRKKYFFLLKQSNVTYSLLFQEYILPLQEKFIFNEMNRINFIF